MYLNKEIEFFRQIAESIVSNDELGCSFGYLGVYQ